METMTLGITLLAILFVLFLSLFIYALSLRGKYPGEGSLEEKTKDFADPNVAVDYTLLLGSGPSE